MKLSEKVKQGQRLTDREVFALGKAMTDGGTSRLKDTYGLDYFSLDGRHQKRIAAEAQRQKAELEALRANTVFGGYHNKEKLNEGLRSFSMEVMGMPTAEYDAWAEQQQARNEANGWPLPRLSWTKN